MYLTAAYLCCMGWLEVNGMMVSVNVGFLKMPVLKPVGVLCMDRSRKFSVQFLRLCREFPLFRSDAVNISMLIVWNSIHNEFDPNSYLLIYEPNFPVIMMHVTQFPSNATSHDVNISHSHSVNSRYLLYIYHHYILLSLFTHTH